MNYEHLVSFVDKNGKDLPYNIISKDTQYYIGAKILFIDKDVVHFETDQVICFIETNQISAITIYKSTVNPVQ